MRHDERWTVPPIAARAWTVVHVTDGLTHGGRTRRRRMHLGAVALRRVWSRWRPARHTVPRLEEAG